MIRSTEVLRNKLRKAGIRTNLSPFNEKIAVPPKIVKKTPPVRSEGACSSKDQRLPTPVKTDGVRGNPNRNFPPPRMGKPGPSNNRPNSAQSIQSQKSNSTSSSTTGKRITRSFQEDDTRSVKSLKMNDSSRNPPTREGSSPKKKKKKKKGKRGWTAEESAEVERIMGLVKVSKVFLLTKDQVNTHIQPKFRGILPNLLERIETIDRERTEQFGPNWRDFVARQQRGGDTQRQQVHRQNNSDQYVQGYIQEYHEPTYINPNSYDQGYYETDTAYQAEETQYDDSEYYNDRQRPTSSQYSRIAGSQWGGRVPIRRGGRGGIRGRGRGSIRGRLRGASQGRGQVRMNQPPRRALTNLYNDEYEQSQGLYDDEYGQGQVLYNDGRLYDDGVQDYNNGQL